MPAAPKAFERLASELTLATNPVRRDELLDEWLDYRDCATEWDAQQWGFDPDRWEERLRIQMERRARDVDGVAPRDDA